MKRQPEQITELEYWKEQAKSCLAIAHEWEKIAQKEKEERQKLEMLLGEQKQTATTNNREKRRAWIPRRRHL